jgi:hypothetical protein
MVLEGDVLAAAGDANERVVGCNAVQRRERRALDPGAVDRIDPELIGHAGIERHRELAVAYAERVLLFDERLRIVGDRREVLVGEDVREIAGSRDLDGHGREPVAGPPGVEFTDADGRHSGILVARRAKPGDSVTGLTAAPDRGRVRPIGESDARVETENARASRKPRT